MKKNYFLLVGLVMALLFTACDPTDIDSGNPFDTLTVSSNELRDKIVVISDLHLGSDLSYSETVKHLKRLEQFLNEVRSSNTVKELVIAGDMLDDWYVPTRIDTYGGGSQADFVRKSVKANQGVYDVLNGIIGDKKIKLTYIPGNHDMGFTAENVNIALPGVNQARDAGDKFGVGVYHPDGYPQIAIEHGHRYDFFCALTPGANEAEAPGSLLPPGYFFARIAANSFTDPTTKEASSKVPAIHLNDSTNPEQYSKYIYYTLWKHVIEEVIYVKDNFSDPIFTTHIGNYTKTYAINDILPRNNATDGSIQINLYNGLFTQANWDARQQYNNVKVLNEINKSIVGSLKTEFIDEQANTQYFQNAESNVQLVVFGHTHEPMIKTYSNQAGDPCLYVNSGTWEDQKTRDKTAAIEQDTLKMHFVTIAPVQSNKKKLNVGLYQYKYGKHTLITSEELDL
ncbi:MAG: metallophosphoesterase [Bacteroidales bacterium]|nr:metallophosphoesterase [Bacteroidales bacterium]